PMFFRSSPAIVRIFDAIASRSLLICSIVRVAHTPRTWPSRVFSAISLISWSDLWRSCPAAVLSTSASSEMRTCATAFTFTLAPPAILSLPPSRLFDDEGTSLHSSDLNALACPQALLRDGGDQGASRRLGDDEDLSPDSGLHGHGDLPVRSNQILEPILARGLGLHEDVDHRVVHDGGQDRREDPRREGDPE